MGFLAQLAERFLFGARNRWSSQKNARHENENNRAPPASKKTHRIAATHLFQAFLQRQACGNGTLESFLRNFYPTPELLWVVRPNHFKNTEQPENHSSDSEGPIVGIGAAKKKVINNHDPVRTTSKTPLGPMLLIEPIAVSKSIHLQVTWPVPSADRIDIPIMQGLVGKRLARALGGLNKQTLRRYDDRFRSVPQSR